MSRHATLAEFDLMTQKVMRGEAVSQAKSEIVSDTLEDKFAQLEKEDEINRMLAELKSRRGLQG